MRLRFVPTPEAEPDPQDPTPELPATADVSDSDARSKKKEELLLSNDKEENLVEWVKSTPVIFDLTSNQKIQKSGETPALPRIVMVA